MADIERLSGQVQLMGGIARDKIDAARRCESLEETRALLLEARDAINTVLEVAALAAGVEWEDDAQRT
jgi:hypothetical protein